MRGRNARIGSAVVLLAALLAACGSIGDPLPPMTHIPEPVDDLAARQIVDEIVVTWTWPLLTTEGATARRLSRFVLEAVNAEADVVDLPPEAIDQHGRELALIEGDRLADKAPGDRIEVRIPLDEWDLERNFILVVASTNHAGRGGGYSNQVRLRPVTPPAAPRVAEPTVSADGIELSWTKPNSANAFGVERRVAGDEEFVVVARVEEGRFIDRAVQWDKEHEYRVRSYRRTGAGDAEGHVSAPLTVTPTDTFPPTVPRGLRAVSTEGSVELSWGTNGEADLAGYIVLRDGEKISELIERANFSDKSAARGVEHRYELVAVDGAGNESALSAAVSAGVASP